MIGLAGGEAHVMWDGLPSLIGQIKGGRLRALAAMNEKRFAIFPDVPTAAEAGLRGMEGGSGTACPRHPACRSRWSIA